MTMDIMEHIISNTHHDMAGREKTKDSAAKQQQQQKSNTSTYMQ
jgi:hypothetical protein